MSKKRREEIKRIVNEVSESDNENENIIVVYDDGEKQFRGHFVSHDLFGRLANVIEGYFR